MFFCYQVKCEKTGKSYVGMTGRPILDRFASHVRDSRRGTQTALHRAIRKYGKKSFSVFELSRHESRSEALQAERDHIKLMNTFSDSGYNMTPGGEGVLSMAAESRQKHRESITERHRDPVFKKKHSEGIRNAMTENVRQKISSSRSGIKMHPNASKAIAEAKKTDWYKEIARKAAQKTWAREGYREKWKKSKKQKHIEKASRFPARDDGLVFASTRDAANYMKKSGWDKAAPNNICLACNGKYKSSCGHAWSWVDGDTAREAGGIIVEP